jgi:hypothetical protein
MTLLSGHTALPKTAAPLGAVRPKFGVVGAGVELRLMGMRAQALPEGALWLPDEGVLIVSDLHLEKGSAFARRGQMLPPYDSRATLSRLSALIAQLRPLQVVSLGDSFHDVFGPERMDGGDLDILHALTAACDWVWIEGNHDPEAPAWLGGRAAVTLEVGALILRHLPQEGPAPGEISGHLHPCAKVSAKGRTVRARCFATDGARLIMPAFGAFTGGLNVCDAAYASVFPMGCVALLLGRERVYPAPPERLIPDR